MRRILFLLKTKLLGSTLSNTNVHIIKKQIFELEVADQSLAREVQDEVSYICRTRLIALIENVFNKVECQLLESGFLTSENSVIRIDTLNLDLGDFSFDDMRDQLGPRIERLIEEAVYEQAYHILEEDKREEKKQANDRDKGHGVVVESEQNEWQLLTYYLKNGNLPWWHKSTGRIDWVTFIDDKYRENEELFTTSIVPLLEDDLVLNRWLFLMPWQKVITYLTEGIANDDRKRIVEKIIEIGAAFIKLQNKAPIINTTSRHQFEKTLVEVLIHLVLHKVELSIIKVEAVFVKELLIHWTNNSLVTFDQLVQKLLEIEIGNIENNQPVLPKNVSKQLILFVGVKSEITSLREFHHALNGKSTVSQTDKKIAEELLLETDAKQSATDEQNTSTEEERASGKDEREKATKTSAKDDLNDKVDHTESSLAKPEKDEKASITDGANDKKDHLESLLDNKSAKDSKHAINQDQKDKEVGIDAFDEKSKNGDQAGVSIKGSENKRPEKADPNTSDTGGLNKVDDQSEEVSSSTSNLSKEELTIEDFYVVNEEGKEQTFDLLAKKKSTLEQNEKAFLDKEAKSVSEKGDSKQEKESSQRESNQRVFEQKKSSNLNQVFVQNAGLVLLNPYLLPFFDGVGLLENKQFIDLEAQYRAVCLLQQVIKPNEPIVEEELALNKLLCGLSPHEPVPLDIALTEEEIEECEHLLAAVKEQWKVLKNTSMNGLRKAFMEREGMLAKESNPFQSGWKLSVTRVTSDILLDKLPWGISMIRLPWNEQLIHVEW